MNNQHMTVQLISTNEPYVKVPKRTKYQNGIKFETTKFFANSNVLLWECTTNRENKHFAKTKAIYF